MDIEVDYNPNPYDHFFISIGLNEKEAISFDYTTKGHRVIKQVLTRVDNNKDKLKNKPDGEWEVIVLKDCQFIKKYHVVWYDYDKEDLVNNELWEKVWEKPIPKEVMNKLLYYSQLISDNYRELNKYKKEVIAFEDYIQKQIIKFRKDDEILKEIHFDLTKNIDEKYQKESYKFFKEKVKISGVRTPFVRKIANKYYNLIKHYPKKEILRLCEKLLIKKYNEDTTIAIMWASKLKNQFEEKDFELFEKWLDKYIDNWGKDDDFCMNILSHFIVNFPKQKERIKTWTKSKNKWKRRASAVSFIQGGSWKIHPQYLKDVFDVAEDLIKDHEDLVQKGMGWMLKIASQPYEKEVFEFVMKHKVNMSRTALRYAIEKMHKELKKEAMIK